MGTDFNDLAQKSGPQAVRETIEAARKVKPSQTVPGGGGDVGASWPDPLLPGVAQCPELPPDLLPGWLGDMVSAVADSTQTPPGMAVMLALSVLAACLQRRFEVAPFHDDYHEPLSLWTLVAATSGSRKTAVIGELISPLLYWEKLLRDRMRMEIARVFAAREVVQKRIEHLRVLAGKSDSAEDREKLQREIAEEKDSMPDELFAPRIFSGDVTAERLQQLLVEQGERMAVLSDEAGMFQVMAGLYSGGQASLDVFLQGHAGASMRVDRAGRSAHLDRPALSFGLALQPGILAEAGKGRRFRDSGLLARFLYAIPVTTVGKRDVRRRVPIPEQVRNVYESSIFNLLEGVPSVVQQPRTIAFTDAARECWLDFAQSVEDRQGEGGEFEPILDWTSKLPGAVARMAGLIELASSGLTASVVRLDAVQRAVRIGTLLIPHAQAAFSLMGADQGDSDALAVLKWIRGNRLKEFTKREAQKSMESRFRRVETLHAALALLIQWQCVSPERRDKTTGGAPRKFHEVNPKVHSAEGMPRS